MNNPEFWLDIHQRVSRTVFWTPVTIAGGCIRDYMLGLEAKDIDVFVSRSRIRHDNLDALVHPEGFEFLGTATEEDYPGAEHQFLVCNYRYMDTDIQIMHLRGEFLFHLESFDCNMGFGQFDGNRTILPLNWMKGYARKEVEVYNDGERTAARAQAFIDKVSEVEAGWRLAPRQPAVDPFAAPFGENAQGGVLNLGMLANVRNILANAQPMRLEPGAVNVMQGRQVNMMIVDDPLR